MFGIIIVFCLMKVLNHGIIVICLFFGMVDSIGLLCMIYDILLLFWIIGLVILCYEISFCFVLAVLSWWKFFFFDKYFELVEMDEYGSFFRILNVPYLILVG